jgi:4-hydroxy-4-methyl-2-oxoglutarate aldolase
MATCVRIDLQYGRWRQSCRQVDRSTGRQVDTSTSAGEVNVGQHVVVRSIDRASTDDIAALAAAGTATVHESQGRTGFAGVGLRPIQLGVRLAGSAVTVSCHPGDNLMIHAAVECCQAGDVLVVTNTAPSTHGMFGELLATSLLQRGVRALVIDAGVRDTAELRAMGFAVWSQHVSCQGTVKASPGSVNVPVVLGGIVVDPGDVVVADDDGVVVVPRGDARQVAGAARQREAKESATRARLQAGELGVDIYGLRVLLGSLGVEYVDRS